MEIAERLDTPLENIEPVLVQNLAGQEPRHDGLAADDLVLGPRIADDLELAVNAPQRVVPGCHQFEIALAHTVEERFAGVELQPLAELGRLDLLVALEDQVAHLVTGSLGDHESQVDIAQTRARAGHGRDLDLKEAL